MGVSVTHAFDQNPSTNTGLTFITGYLSTRLVYLLSSVINMHYIPQLAHSILSTNLWNLFFIFLYLPLYFFPINGDVRNETIRYVLWSLATFLTIFGPLLQALYSGHMKNKMGVNIEHMTERMGLLIVLGF
jgi:low temperature requirement protein LtrA